MRSGVVHSSSRLKAYARSAHAWRELHPGSELNQTSSAYIKTANQTAKETAIITATTTISATATFLMFSRSFGAKRLINATAIDGYTILRSSSWTHLDCEKTYIAARQFLSARTIFHNGLPPSAFLRGGSRLVAVSRSQTPV